MKKLTLAEVKKRIAFMRENSEKPDPECTSFQSHELRRGGQIALDSLTLWMNNREAGIEEPTHVD